MAIGPYRPQDGWIVRRLFFVLLVAFGGFSAYRVYVWMNAVKLRQLPVLAGHVFSMGELLGLCVLAVFAVGAYVLMFKNRRTSDFLVEVESELKKVREQMDAERAAVRVPAGAPPADTPSLDGLSPRDKIAAGIKHPTE